MFLVASPKSIFDKKVKTNRGEVLINATSISEVLFEKCNVLINNDEWTGIPGFCRFVLSIDESYFQEGLRRIEQFEV